MNIPRYIRRAGSQGPDCSVKKAGQQIYIYRCIYMYMSRITMNIPRYIRSAGSQGPDCSVKKAGKQIDIQMYIHVYVEDHDEHTAVHTQCWLPGA